MSISLILALHLYLLAFHITFLLTLGAETGILTLLRLQKIASVKNVLYIHQSHLIFIFYIMSFVYTTCFGYWGPSSDIPTKIKREN